MEITASREFVVLAQWDPEANVWVASSETVPGLSTEADTLEHLVEKLEVIVPELLEENGLIEPDDGQRKVPFYLHAPLVGRACA